MTDSYAFETQAIHAGQQADPTTGAVMTPIYQSSTYRQTGVGEHLGYEYSRTGNPTRTALEKCLAVLESGSKGLAFASGMAATDAVLRLLNPGDHVLAVDDLYGGTYRLFQNVYVKYGISMTYAAAQDTTEFLSHLNPSTRLVWIETPTNPLLNLCDIQSISDGLAASGGEALLCVDNTFATPYLQKPIELGANLVVHSTTKYLGGHSDVVGGAIVVDDPEIADQLAFLQNAVGAIPGPMDCFLVLRGIKTLPVRMERHAQNAQKISENLANHSSIDRVIYPTQTTHPQRELAQRQMKNGGGIVSVVLRGGEQAARKFAESTRLFTLAESLGGVESLIEVPAMMTHASTGDSPYAVDRGLVRLSVGLENAQDLIEDLSQALDQAS